MPPFTDLYRQSEYNLPEYTRLEVVIPKSRAGYDNKRDYGVDTEIMLRPIAETLCLLTRRPISQWESYLPEAYEVFFNSPSWQDARQCSWVQDNVFHETSGVAEAWRSWRMQKLMARSWTYDTKRMDY